MVRPSLGSHDVLIVHGVSGCMVYPDWNGVIDADQSTLGACGSRVLLSWEGARATERLRRLSYGGLANRAILAVMKRFEEDPKVIEPGRSSQRS